MKDATIQKLRAGKAFVTENDTEVEPKLRILLSGKLTVKCDDIFLHFVQPFEFVDSVEWWARGKDRPDENYQVSTSKVYPYF